MARKKKETLAQQVNRLEKEIAGLKRSMVLLPDPMEPVRKLAEELKRRNDEEAKREPSYWRIPYYEPSPFYMEPPFRIYPMVTGEVSKRTEIATCSS